MPDKTLKKLLDPLDLQWVLGGTELTNIPVYISLVHFLFLTSWAISTFEVKQSLECNCNGAEQVDPHTKEEATGQRCKSIKQVVYTR